MNKLLTLLGLCFSVGLFAQKPTNTPDFTNFINPFQTKSTGLPTVLQPETAQTYSISEEKGSYFVKFTNKPNISNINETLQTVFALRQTDMFSKGKVFTDELGYVHTRYRQLYQGLQVFGGEIITHEKNNLVETINGHFYKNLTLSVTPNVQPQTAIAKAIQAVGAEQYRWQTPDEDFYKQMTGGTLQPQAELVIAPLNGNFTADAYRLAYKVTINASKPYGVYDLFIDALTGQVIWKLNKLANTDAIGTAQTAYSGTQQITTDNTGSGFRLRESGRGVQTFNMNKGTNFNNAVDFTDADNNWIPSGVALSQVKITQINNNWYTNFSENPSNGGMPDLFIVLYDANNNVLHQSATVWNQMPTVTFSNIGVNLNNGSTYTIEIWDNDNSVLSHDFLGSFSFTAGSAGTANFSNSGNTGTFTLGQATAEPALDAHWGMEKTYDFYLTKLNRNSYNGTGGLIRSFVHYDNALENAFWDPSLQVMVFGDGAGTFSPLTSIDVAGHEFSHAVITNTADLVYQGESGALNESFADIFGVAIEFFAKPATADWTVGNEITLVSPYYLRSMSNPNSGLSPQPDTYNGTSWADPSNLSYDEGGVHINSGVQNYWFYLLANGGSGTNDLGNAFSVTGIGLDPAVQIAYRNLSVYLNQNSNFLDAVTGSIQAAQDLYGANSTQVMAVRNAWYAVGLANLPNASCSGLTTLTASADAFSDGSGTANYQDNANCSWLIQPAGASQITLNFTSFATEAGYDSLKVYDGANMNAPLILQWTGNTLPPSVTSTTGAMFVRFVSDNSQTAAGWEANYTSSGTAFCNGGQTLTAGTGSFSDGSGASNYGNNAFCYWNIAPAGATSITLNFTAFNTEQGYDGVIVYDGESVNDPILLNWSGTNLPSAVTSSAGKMLVVFTSDATVTAAGFEANYTVSGGNNYCGNTTLTDDFAVLSDGSANSNYYNNSLCTWLIQPTNAQAITLYFTAFDLENGSADGTTVYDAVEIYDGATANAPLLGRFYGTSLPSEVSSTGGSMFIKFFSDASVTAGGWDAYYITQTSSYCQGDVTLTANTGTITDGSGANDYGNGSECTWFISSASNTVVSLNFTEFDTEANFDFVLVYDGIDENAPLLGSFSGSTLPPLVTSTNGIGIYVVFISDESIRANGFTANYSKLPVSTENIENDYHLAVFPNPFKNNVTVQYDLKAVETARIDIIDILGRKVFSEALGKQAAGQQQRTLDTSDLPNGTYILQLTIGEKTVNQRLIKQ